jgi:hypothetical protein
MNAAQQSGSTHVFGIVAISRFVGLNEGETAKRIATGELPCEFVGTGQRRMAIAPKSDLKAIISSPHWRRERLDAAAYPFPFPIPS